MGETPGKLEYCQVVAGHRAGDGHVELLGDRVKKLYSLDKVAAASLNRHR